MKHLLSITMLLAIFALPACKKANNDSTNTGPETPTDQRTGLASLSDPSSTNYIVLVVQRQYTTRIDTIILQTSQGDTSKLTTTTPQYLFLGYAPTLKNEFCFKTANPNRYKSVAIDFYQFKGNTQPTASCAWLDSLVRDIPYDSTKVPGTVAPGMNVSINDSYWGEESNSLNYIGKVGSVQSITKLSNASGCQKARVKGVIAPNLGLKNLPCGATPSYVIIGGAFQLDYAVQQ